MEIGKINKLDIARTTDFGYYLEDEERNEVLLPNADVPENIKIGESIEVFIYRDSENRIIASTRTPTAMLGNFALMQVKQVNQFGAFMDWGLQKDLLVPYSEQIEDMEEGNWYLVYLIKDEKSDRLVGSCKVNDYTSKENINLNANDEVEALLYRMTDLGMNAIVNNKYKALIFHSDIHKFIQIGDKIKAYVKEVREDGNIDLSLSPLGYKNSIDKNIEIILHALIENNGFLDLNDKSDPETIKYMIGLSKKAFKKAVGKLYKQKRIDIKEDGIHLIQ